MSTMTPPRPPSFAKVGPQSGTSITDRFSQTKVTVGQLSETDSLIVSLSEHLRFTTLHSSILRGYYYRVGPGVNQFVGGVRFACTTSAQLKITNPRERGSIHANTTN